MVAQRISLENLLRLCFPEPFDWLAGERDAAITAGWVATVIDDLAKGDLLLLPADQVSRAQIDQAMQRQASAVILAGKLPDRDMSLSENDIQIPVVVVDVEEDLRDVQRLLVTMLVNQRAGLREREIFIHEQLSQLALEGRGLEGLIRAMGEISGRGVLIQDKRLQILAQHPTSSLLAIWEDITQQLVSMQNLPESLHDRKQAGRQPMIVTQEIPGGLARLVAPIRVGDVARGYLSLIGLANELDTLDQLVVEQGAQVCAIEMARAKAIREAEKRLKGNLITALLQENLSPRDARLWAQNMGLELDQAHVALRFAWSGASPPSRRRLETLVNGEVTLRGLKAITSPMGAEVVCFCQVPRNSERPELALTFAQAVLDKEVDEYPGSMALCGVGTTCRDLIDWRNSFRQAGQALEMARRLAERKPLYFPDLSVYRLLMQIEHNPELVAFQEETLGALLAYDGGLELIHTLEAYFEHNGNLSQTAEALYVHRNTLIYRMERIAEITGLDLDRPDTRLAVQLALYISRMMGTIRGKPGQE
jgi:purine catabolism regulator